MQSSSQTKNHGHCSGNETSAHMKLRALTMYLYARLAWSISVVVGKAYEYYQEFITVHMYVRSCIQLLSYSYTKLQL